MDDEFSKAFDFHQADLVHEHTHGRSHFTLFMSLKLQVKMGQGNSLCYLQIYTNLPMRNKTLPILQLGFLLNRSRNSHNRKHAVAAGNTTKSARFRKDPMVHEQEYQCYMKI
jgi:hypothetical protein